MLAGKKPNLRDIVIFGSPIYPPTRVLSPNVVSKVSSSKKKRRDEGLQGHALPPPQSGYNTTHLKHWYSHGLVERRFEDSPA
ncbi:TPA: hypothetical protein N0F65_005674 [Lagenidium giganteum]|uniref:Uncharacterized protein n=1 Tax=Lagenidium giganteum TaxID=4803 RepID=A0AAV2ZET4_9STRA|nr:TPA: hypothetical protein N0F65_005674 [Lagenidium giganteum]